MKRQKSTDHKISRRMQVGAIAMLVGAATITCAIGGTAGLAKQRLETETITDRQKQEANGVTIQTNFKPFNPEQSLRHTVSFSPDGKLIAAGDALGDIYLWKPDGTLIRQIKGNKVVAIFSVSFSPDGQTLASSSIDGAIKLWKLDGTLIKTLSGPERGVFSVRFSPDGQTLASGSIDGTIQLWTRDGTLIKTLGTPSNDKFGEDPVYSMSFSPDGQTLASTSTRGVKLWRREGTLIKTLSNQSTAQGDVSFSPDGELIAATFASGIRLWKQDGTLVMVKKLTDRKRGGSLVKSVDFSPDGKTIAVGIANSILELRDLSGNLIKRLDIDRNGGFADASFSPDGKAIAVSTVVDTGIIKLNEP